MITLRPIEMADVPSFRETLDEVARERRYLLLLEAPPLSAVEAAVRSDIQAGVTRIVAVRRGRVVGWCDIVRRSLPGLQHSGVLGMGVAKAYRRRGLGSRLLDVAVRAARTNGLTRIELEVLSSNRGAYALYLRHGFEFEGVKRQARYLDGDCDDLLIMAVT